MKIPSIAMDPNTDLVIPRKLWSCEGMPFSHMLIWAYLQRSPRATAEQVAIDLHTNVENVMSAIASVTELVLLEGLGPQGLDPEPPSTEENQGVFAFRKKKKRYAGPQARKHKMRQLKRAQEREQKSHD